MSALVRLPHGWQARIQKKRGRGYFSRSFPARKLGGWNKAKAAAVEWLENQGEPYENGKRRPSPRRSKPTARNRSGVVGVYKTHDGKGREYWVAHTPLAASKARTFSIGRRKDREARRLAVACRKEYEAELRQRKE